MATRSARRSASSMWCVVRITLAPGAPPRGGAAGGCRPAPTPGPGAGGRPPRTSPPGAVFPPPVGPHPRGDAARVGAQRQAIHRRNPPIPLDEVVNLDGGGGGHAGECKCFAVSISDDPRPGRPMISPPPPWPGGPPPRPPPPPPVRTPPAGPRPPPDATAPPA